MEESALYYPSHPDFDYSREVQATVAQRDKDWARKPWTAIVVSQGWQDADHVEDFIDALAAKYEPLTVVLPERAVGASKLALERCEAQGFEIVTVRSEGTWATHRQAVQATHICQLADVIVVFWAGGSDLCKALIDKALLVHRPVPQFDPGLHVYEMTKTRATRSKKSQHTGRIKYRTRKAFALIEPQTERKAA